MRGPLSGALCHLFYMPPALCHLFCVPPALCHLFYVPPALCHQPCATCLVRGLLSGSQLRGGGAAPGSLPSARAIELPLSSAGLTRPRPQRLHVSRPQRSGKSSGCHTRCLAGVGVIQHAKLASAAHVVLDPCHYGPRYRRGTGSPPSVSPCCHVSCFAMCHASSCVTFRHASPCRHVSPFGESE